MARTSRSKVRQAAKEAGYRSGFEHRVATDLAARGVEFAYEPKTSLIKYELREVRRYLPDFQIGAVIVECKGRLTAADRKKLLLVKAQYPEKDIRLLFECDNKLSPSSKTRYSAWADKHGIPWALKKVPDTWL